MAPGDDKKTACSDPGCVFCANRKGFEFPPGLYEVIAEGKVVLFAGSGVSTEGVNVFPCSFYEGVAQDLGLNPEEAGEFPSLMSKYCRPPFGRAALIRKIRARMDYLRAFPEVYRLSSAFHREMANIPVFSEIFTTNWDTLFEEETGAIPVVDPSDMVFQELPGRKVFKIHGSISQYQTIVATEEDYEKCEERLRTGVIGSVLRTALATKPALFVGYSLRDSDFRVLYEFVRREMGDVQPSAYLVALEEGSAQGFPITTIATDATYFMHFLKKRLIDDGVMLPDDWIEDAQAMLVSVLEAHRQLQVTVPVSRNPESVYCAFYQDGLIHALEYLLEMVKTGRYSTRNDFASAVATYKAELQKNEEQKRYPDCAYITGYLCGMAMPIAPPDVRATLPCYYVLGLDETLQSLEDYLEAAKKTKDLVPDFMEPLDRMMKAWPNSETDEIEWHHQPFLTFF